MESSPPVSDRHAPVEVDLKNRHLAALLAWLWPGAGHIYQRRVGKGILFMACIVSTYFFGLALGEGRVVYASYDAGHKRYPFLCQIGVGIPSLGAVAQAVAKKQWHAPLFGLSWMYPPDTISEEKADELSSWQEELHAFFEMGTLYTMIAGLLNMLVIYDAWAGPAFPEPTLRQKESPDAPEQAVPV